MEFKKVQQIHKKLYKLKKSSDSDQDKIFIRHWNVFYNQLMKRDICVIEQSSRTILYSGLLKEIINLFGQDYSEIDVPYLNKLEIFNWIISYSSLYKKLKEMIEETSKQNEVSNV